MKKISIIFILLSFSSFIWADNNEKGVYVAKFYIEYENVSSYLSNLGGINILHYLSLQKNNNKDINFNISHFGFKQNSYYTREIPIEESVYNLNFYTDIKGTANSVSIDENEYSYNVNHININPCNDNVGNGNFEIKIKNQFTGSQTYETFIINYHLEIRPKEIKCRTSNERILLYEDTICIRATKGFPKDVYKWRFQYKNANGQTIKGNFTPSKTEDNGATIYVKGSDFLSVSDFHDLVYREENISIMPDGASEKNKPLSFTSVNLTAKPSAPNITKVTFDKPKCPNKPATNIIVYLDRPIAKGENIILQFIDESNQKKVDINASICGSNEIKVNSIEARKWKIIYLKTTYKNKSGKDISSDSEGDKMRAQIEITTPEQLSLNFKKSTKTKCYGDSNGEISCHIKGGTGSKTYSLSRENVLVKTLIKGNNEACDFKGLSAGTYSISATDTNGCKTEKEETITIGEPQPVTISASVESNPKCYGSSEGIIKYESSGGTGNIKCYIQNSVHEFKDSTYSNSFSGLAAGTYYLSAEDKNGCSSKKIETLISEPERLYLSLETKNVTINGTDNGSLSASFSGGTEPYTLSFDNRELNYSFPLDDVLLNGNMKAGEGTVTLLDDNGCSTFQNYNITEPDTISARVKQIDFIKCFEDSTASLQIENIKGGMGGYTIEWFEDGDLISKDTSISNLPAGEYLVFIKDSVGAVTNYEITIDQPKKINLLPSITNSACVGEATGSILLSADGGTTPYIFSLENNTDSSGEYHDLPVGIYAVSVKDENGCTTDSIVEIKTLSDIILNVKSSSPSCYNTKNGTISISIENGIGPYFVRLADKDFSQVKATLELTNLKAGSYNIEVIDSLGCSKTTETILTKPKKLNIELPEKIYLCKGQSETINIENERVTNVDWYLNEELIHTGFNNTLTQEGVYKLHFTYGKHCHSYGEIEVDTINKKVDANFLVAAEIPVNDDAHLLNITKVEDYDYQEWVYPLSDAWVYGEDENSLQLVFLKEGVWDVGLVSYLDKCKASLFKTVKTFTPDNSSISEDNTYHISELSIDKSPNNGKFTAKIELSDKTDIKLYLYNASNGHIIDTKEVSGEKTYEIKFDIFTATGEYILLAVAPTWQKSKWIKMIIK